MHDKSIYFIATLMGGAVLPVQVALNALLRRYVGQPMQVTFISYLAGTLASLAICWFAIHHRSWQGCFGRCPITRWKGAGSPNP